MYCDLCSNTISADNMVRIPIKEMQQAVRNGFNPYKTPGIDMSTSKAVVNVLALDIEVIFRDWYQKVMIDTTDWGLCPTCAEVFHQSTKRTPISNKQISTETIVKGTSTDNIVPTISYNIHAGFWKRSLAAIFDGIILNVVMVIIIAILVIFGFPTEFSDQEAFLFYAFGALFGWIYYAGLESSSRQATFGKAAVGIIVTDINGDRISFVKATVRHLGKIISTLMLFIGFLMIGFSERKQGIHDIIAGTHVMTSSNTVKKYRCVRCKKEFESKDDIIQYPDNQLVCKQCDKELDIGVMQDFKHVLSKR